MISQSPNGPRRNEANGAQGKKGATEKVFVYLVVVAAEEGPPAERELPAYRRHEVIPSGD